MFFLFRGEVSQFAAKPVGSAQRSEAKSHSQIKEFLYFVFLFLDGMF